MSIEAVAWALNVTVEKAVAKLVLIGLANHATAEFDEARPAVPRLARYAGCSERSVQRHLRALEEAGWIVKSGEHPIEGRRDRSVNVYRLVRERGDILTPREASGVTESTERGDRALSPEPSKGTVQETADAVSPGEPPLDGPEAGLCQLLADLIRERDPKAKVAPASQRWLTDMRLLVKDRGDVAEVEQVIRWCQAHHFWGTVILSPGNLRKQFTALKLRAGATGEQQVSPLRQRTDRRLARLRALQDAEQDQSQLPPGGNHGGTTNGSGSDHPGRVGDRAA